MNNTTQISVIGLGYVGFPLAIQAASKGLLVRGVDSNPDTVKAVNNAQHFLHDPFVVERLARCEMKATTEFSSSDAYIICVPTPVTNFSDPDLSYVKSAVESVAAVIEDDQLVVIESTINPGVSEEVVAPILEGTGKKYHLAHCPERINPGDPKWTVANIPRVVGGTNTEPTRRAAELYRRIIDAEITELSQIAAAESTKILENTFRDVNIAFINEMARSFHKLGIDVNEVVRGASTKPFGFMPHLPGIGVGGHCIAVDPYYMIERGKQVGFDHIFLKQARKINSEMPEFALQLLQDGLNEVELPLKGTTVAVLGLAYKPNIRDDRESPAYSLLSQLRQKGAKLLIFDPYYPEKSDRSTLAETLAESQAAVIVTAHREFLDESLYSGQKVVLDGRNCLDKNKFFTSEVGPKGHKDPDGKKDRGAGSAERVLNEPRALQGPRYIGIGIRE